MGERKIRSDKKRDVKPTVPLDLRDCIYRLSFITDTPVKDVIEAVLLDGSKRKRPLSHLSQYFLRDVRVGQVVYLGDPDRVPVGRRGASGKTVRISTRVTQDMYNDLEGVAYAMGCSVSRAAALLIDATVRDVDFVNDFVRSYLEENVDEERMRDLRRVLKYINADNPYSERISYAALLSYLVDEVRVGAERVQDTVSEFVIRQWNK
ncbi:hypothetical protein [Sporosarcina trichiuri]|uniref:hypothetical protein n=1 Tax=Sporosarcina trichiuri TaxID=3056445 RepID=UPI0025B292E8|nr:hypothetical protein [Sporosarcina sp. 0.2-SM1T-5]WJY27498.1 hypothetical protein QWT68_00305 [Sporosarcina sp. 0.2-SM1T-5]